MASSTSSGMRNIYANGTRTAYLDHYLALFLTRLKPTMRVGKGGMWYAADRKLTRREFSLAITGQKSLGLYAVSERGNSLWLCLDADTDEAFKGLAAVAFNSSDQDNVLLERSRRGGHLWIFGPPTPWQQVQTYGHYLAATYGLRKIEIFPKGPGLNGVRAPASRHPKTGICYPFLDPKTGEVLDDFQTVILKLQQRPFPHVHHRHDQHAGPHDQRAEQHDRHGDRHLELLAEVERYTTLRHIHGKRYRGQCPFHRPDRHPSFGVSGIVWQCWTCRIGGYLADFRRYVKERGV